VQIGQSVRSDEIGVEFLCWNLDDVPTGNLKIGRA